MLPCVCLAWVVAAHAQEFDVFRTQRNVSPTAAGHLLDGTVAGMPCTFGGVGSPLALGEAVERALCGNPKTREAWANVKVQAAAVGAGKGAYLPTLSATWQGVRDDSVTNVTGHPELSSANRTAVRSETVSANWVLWDFGGRSAALRNATELLAASRANQEATLQDTFANVAKDYYAAQAAWGALDAARQTETLAHGSFVAASERVGKGIAPVSDQLQAQTSYVQAVSARSKAEGDLATAVGTLASDMDLPPSTALILPAVVDGVMPDSSFNESVDDLIDDAERMHPSLLAARAQADAASAKADQTRAEGLPSVSLVAKYSANNQPASLGLGIPEFPATGHDWFIGVQVSIPIFEGFVRNYQVMQAQAQAEVQRETVNEVAQHVALDVWTSYQTLQTGIQNVTNSAELFEVSTRSFEAAQHRYSAGVGNILELLNAQSALADARKQRIQALTDWRNDRLQLAGKLGRLGMSDVTDVSQ
ncbi:TolC family protein [Paraburkholderia edwinii]|uniref:Protein CyaE n=1 Tax=Paraburkholderia edwinii TaxID=2861782 RepID=A0ABX8UTR5_9BURK|nr:TolC family protein [Paraburkholderia edwinii]QYD71677.1 TolC family protein [Paraburkholderia edwinii]